MLHRKPKRRALRQFDSAEDLRQQWRQLIGAPASGDDHWPVVPAGVPAYAEELRGFAPPDWSFVLEYPYASDEFAPTQWGGEATLRPCHVTP